MRLELYFNLPVYEWIRYGKCLYSLLDILKYLFKLDVEGSQLIFNDFVDDVSLLYKIG